MLAIMTIVQPRRHTEEVTNTMQKIRLNPKILDRAKELTGSRSDDQLGQAFLNLTGATIRNYRNGKSLPTVVTLARLRELTGMPMDQMILMEGETVAA